MFKRLIDEQSIQDFKYKERQISRGDRLSSSSDHGLRIMHLFQSIWKQSGHQFFRSSLFHGLKLSLPYFLITLQTAYLFFLQDRVTRLESRPSLKQEIIQTLNELKHDQRNTQPLATAQDLASSPDNEIAEVHIPDKPLSNIRYLAYQDLAGERRALLICEGEELWLKSQQWCGTAMLKHIDVNVLQLLIQQQEYWLKREQG
jgi:hypothetical protein